jgi:hypothetical protein
MLNQSFRQVFVSNLPALLPNGKTVENIAIGQVGILDAKTHTAVTAPTYGNNKALKIVWGTADIEPMMFFGNYNQNEYSKLIKGKLLRNFRGKKAQRGQHQIVTVGNSGDVSDTDTLFAKPGEHRELFLNLTGDAIDREFSNQGLMKRYFYQAPLPNDCEDVCVDVDCRAIAENLVRQINADKDVNRYVKATVITQCTPALPAATTAPLYRFRLTVIDSKDQLALGNVQAQYPDFKVRRIGEDGMASVYEILRETNAIPAAFSNAGNIVISDCATCPAGYTYIDNAFAYEFITQDAGDAAALTAVKTQFGITGDEYVTRTAYEYGQSTYVVVADAAIAPANGLREIGEVRQSCVLNTATTTAWTAAGTLYRYERKFRITLADDKCGNDRLAELQAAYPDLVITLVNAAGDCVHTYETTVLSEPVELGCSIDIIRFAPPSKFEMALWQEVPEAPLAPGTTCLCGIRLEVSVNHRKVTDISYGKFPHDVSAVYLEVSSGNADWNSQVPLENFWAVKNIQGVKFAQGDGAYIQKLERDSLNYARKHRNDDLFLNELEGYEFQAKPGIFYDEYALEFDFQYMVGGWSEKYTDTYTLFVYFPEGQGKAFEAAINNYISSAAIDIDPVVL